MSPVFLYCIEVSWQFVLYSFSPKKSYTFFEGERRFMALVGSRFNVLLVITTESTSIETPSATFCGVPANKHNLSTLVSFYRTQTLVPFFTPLFKKTKCLLLERDIDYTRNCTKVLTVTEEMFCFSPKRLAVEMLKYSVIALY